MGDRLALGDDELEHRISEQTACRCHRNRPEAGHLAELLALDMPAPQRLDVETQESQVFRWRKLPPYPAMRAAAVGSAFVVGRGPRTGLGRAPCHLDQSIKGVGAAALVGPRAGVLAEDPVGQAFDLGRHHRAIRNCSAGGQSEGTLGINFVHRPPLTLDSRLGGLRVRIASSTRPLRGLPQLSCASCSRLLEQRLLSRGVHASRRHDHTGLGGRQLTVEERPLRALQSSERLGRLQLSFGRADRGARDLGQMLGGTPMPETLPLTDAATRPARSTFAPASTRSAWSSRR